MTAYCPLAVACEQTGRASETFIQRHIEGLSPASTFVFSDFLADSQSGFWRCESPQFAVYGPIAGDEPDLGKRIARAFDRRFHLRVSDRRRQAIIKNLMDTHKVRVVMGEHLDWSFPWFLLCQDLQIPFFAHAHGADIHIRGSKEKWRARYRLLTDAAGIITPDQTTRRKLIDFGLPARKCHVIPCGVDVPEVVIDHPQRDEIRCIAVGRMVPKKGPLHTLRAFRLACESTPNLTMDFVGSGPLFDDCVRFVADNGLTRQVKLHGAMPNGEVQQLMRNADLFLQHSLRDPLTGDQEGAPVAVKEAMAFGLPVIATRHAGIPEIVVHDETGYLVDEGDVAKMAAYIVELSRQSNMRRELGHAGWLRVRETGSWEQERHLLRSLMGL